MTTAVVPVRSLGVPVLPRAAVPAGLRVGAGFSAFFGTLWLVQGALALAGPVAATAALVPGLGIAVALWRTRGRVRPAPVTLSGHLAGRYVNRAALLQLVVSVPGSVAVQLLVDEHTVLPFVVVTVGLYLAALVPAVRVPHLAAAALALTVIPLVTLARFDGPDLVLATGLSAGAAFLLKGALDVVVAARPR